MRDKSLYFISERWTANRTLSSNRCRVFSHLHTYGRCIFPDWILLAFSCEIIRFARGSFSDIKISICIQWYYSRSRDIRVKRLVHCENTVVRVYLYDIRIYGTRKYFNIFWRMYIISSLIFISFINHSRINANYLPIFEITYTLYQYCAFRSEFSSVTLHRETNLLLSHPTYSPMHVTLLAALMRVLPTKFYTVNQKNDSNRDRRTCAGHRY